MSNIVNIEKSNINIDPLNNVNNQFKTNSVENVYLSDLNNSELSSISSNSTGSTYEECNGYWDSSESFNGLKVFGEELIKNTKKLGATVATGLTSTLEGLGLFGESLIDATNLIGTGVLSVPTGIADGIGYLVKRDDWSSLTGYMWDRTQEKVSEENMKNSMDYIYNSTSFGQALKENSWGFDTTRSVGNGVGYTVGVVGASVFTLGSINAISGITAATTTSEIVASNASTLNYIMSGYAGVSGFGKGTSDAWNNGASLNVGPVAGLFTGLLEGTQFFAGGKIMGLSPFQNNFLNSSYRIILNGIMGINDSIYRPAISAIYKDGYYDSNGNFIRYKDDTLFINKWIKSYEEAGGKESTAINFLIGAGLSTLGEAFNLKNKVNDYSKYRINSAKINKLKTWTSTEMLKRFKEKFGDYVDVKLIDKTLDNSFVFLTEDELINEFGDSYVGFNYDGKSYIDVERSLLEVKSTASHESIHQIAWYEMGSGVDNGKRVGINEALTEYFAQLIMGEEYPINHCSYEPSVLKIKTLVNEGIFTNEELMHAYFVDHDLSVLNSRFKNVSANKFFELFDDAISDDPELKNKALDQIEKYIQELIKSRE